MTTIGYFLEDAAHEKLFLALVQRVAQEVGFRGTDLRHDVRISSGGAGRVISELRWFLADVKRGREGPFDVLVITLDSNCAQFVERRNEVLDLCSRLTYGGDVVAGIPEPHIEAWYLADPQAIARVAGLPRPPQQPVYKCERDWYKIALDSAFDSAGIRPPLGGAEYGSDLAARIDFFRAGQSAPSFRHFLTDLRDSLSRRRPRQP